MEQMIKTLSQTYRTYGYRPYCMSKFEEYGLYLQNKDFLISDRILTFTDTDGRLMALKPDVTLSIIKNTVDPKSGVEKLYYRENVYRPGKNEQGFREIMQVGLECMGDVDTYCIFEVLLLAVKSLKTISDRCVLDVSHMGLVSRMLDAAGLSGSARDLALKAIGEKNAHELRKICTDSGANPELPVRLTQICGKTVAILPELEALFGDAPELVQFKQLLAALDQAGVDCINVDFSVVNDMKYYNGIVFRGFVEGVPEGILSGGQYDGLMEQMNRSGKAIGFALYPDLLERIVCQPVQSADAVLFYDESADVAAIADAVEALGKTGICVVAKPGPVNKCGAKCYRLAGNKAIPVEV